MGDLQSLRDQGEAAWSAGQWELAQAAYTAIAEVDPSDDLANARNCWLNLFLGEIDEGMKHLRRRSDHYLEQGDTESALTVFREAQAEFPKVLEIANDLGCLLIALGYVEEGTEHFRRLGHDALDIDIEEAMEAFRRWDFLKRLKSIS